MKNKFLTAILGTAAVMSLVTGCGQQDAETELQTLEITAIETVAETEQQSEEIEFMELDLSELQETSSPSVEISTDMLIEGEDLTETDASASASGTHTRKPGEPETETEIHVQETEKVKKPTKPAAQKQETLPETEQVTEAKRETETEQAVKHENKVETESAKQAVNQTATEQVTEMETEAVTEWVTETETETVTEAVTETETEAVTEAVTETETETVTEAVTETETETEAVTEPVTETETEAVTEQITETETESETEQATETETETEQATETETETEQQIYMTVTDRVNVRREANTESDTLDLLIPGNLFEVTDETGEWSRICYRSESAEIAGYLKTEFLIGAEAVYAAKENVNVRKEASVDAEKQGQLLADDQVVVTNIELEDDAAKQPEWLAVCFSKDGKLVEGYVKAEFMEQVDLDELLNETALEAQSETAVQQSETASDESEQNVSDAETETESEQETETETEIQEIMLSYGLKGQLELLQLLFPGKTNVGIIYSSKDRGAAVQLAEYETLADTYGLNIQTAEILDEKDIDLTASILVGSVDCILCLNDQVVNGLAQTICAYAEEVQIPVIGISQAQTDMGCVASYDGTTVFWNDTEAARFGLSSDMLHLVNEVID